MVLQFRPPEDLINAYLNRPSPGEQASQGINQALQTYVQMKAQEQKTALDQQQRDIEIAKGISTNGQDFADALKQIQAQRSAPQTMPNAQGPSLIQRALAHFNKTPVGKSPDQEAPAGTDPYASMPGMATATLPEPSTAPGSPAPVPGKPTPPVMGSDPALEEFLRVGSQGYQKQHGSAGLAKVKTALEIEKGLQDKSKSPATVEQYQALQSGDPEALAKAFPNGIPENFISPSLSATARNVTIVQGPTGTPIRVSKAPGTKAEAVDVPGVSNTANPIQSKLTPNEYKDWLQEVNQFDSDTVVKADRNILANLNQIGTEISKYNKAMTGPLKSQQARAIAREVGALTDSDVARQALDPSMIGRLKSWASIAATGEIPKDQLELLRSTVQTINQSASSRIATVAQERAARKANLYGGKVSPQDLMGSLNLPTSFSIPENKTTQVGMVTIRDSQGGMHTLPSASLEAAKKRDPGLTVIQ